MRTKFKKIIEESSQKEVGKMVSKETCSKLIRIIDESNQAVTENQFLHGKKPSKVRLFPVTSWSSQE
jgi:hypothetical protein